MEALVFILFSEANCNHSNNHPIQRLCCMAQMVLGQWFAPCVSCWCATQFVIDFLVTHEVSKLRDWFCFLAVHWGRYMLIYYICRQLAEQPSPKENILHRHFTYWLFPAVEVVQFMKCVAADNFFPRRSSRFQGSYCSNGAALGMLTRPRFPILRVPHSVEAVQDPEAIRR